MRATVFGGNGFIGSHLVDLLLAEGHRVRVFDHQPEAFRPPLDGVDYRMADFADTFAVAEALEGVDVAYHLISTTVPGTSNRDPIADIEANLAGTVRLLDQLVKARVRRIVFLSSGGAIYGNPQALPVSEDHPTEPICSYAIVKMAVEKYLFMYQKLHDLEPLVLRGSNPYGPRQGHRGVQGFIMTALCNVLDGAPIRVWGDGSVVRDYLYIEDLAQLCLTAGLSGETGVFNAGSGIGHSLNDVIGCIGDVIGRAPDVTYEPGASFDVETVVLDIARATSTFAWEPSIDLREGVRRTWAWLEASRSP